MFFEGREIYSMTDLNRDDLMKIFKKVKASVRQKAKEAGAPLYYMHNGQYVREEPSGERIVLDRDYSIMDPFYKK
ncbi:hypothetical protein [Paenibacillus humicola]|uniref:hypothetical protein n=1 Tax=Paenibacillus humicola TaxID=3110540 RepID=UPI00237BF65D|nr:hypothetical protein [Paenibacillus humicola]